MAETCISCSNEANPAKFCDVCHGGPFCAFCLILRHGVPCGKKSLWRRIREFLGLELINEPAILDEDTVERIANMGSTRR